MNCAIQVNKNKTPMIAQKIDTHPNRIELKGDISSIVSNLRKVNPNAKTCLPVLDGNIFIHVLDISHFKSDDIYCRLFTTCGKMYFVSKSMKWVEQKLFKYGFYRIHKSFLINVASIAQYHKSEGGYLTMDCGNHIPISRSKKHQIGQMLELL